MEGKKDRACTQLTNNIDHLHTLCNHCINGMNCAGTRAAARLNEMNENKRFQRMNE